MEKGRSAYKLPPPRRKLYQSQISRSGIIAPLKTRWLLTKINTIFDFEWTCFGCNVSTFKQHHYSKSYLKHESDRFSINKLDVNVQAFLSCEDLVLLCHDEEKFCKKLGVSCNTYHEQLS